MMPRSHVSSKLHCIYVPGLGANEPNGQQKAVDLWRWYGVEPELFQAGWSGRETWESKFNRLLERVDALHNQDTQVALVGASAGASAVINAYAARKDQIVGCVLIAGKVNRPESIGQRIIDEDPAFVVSAIACEKALEELDASHRKRILSIYSFADGVVTRADSRVPGARNRIVFTPGHVNTIATQLVLGAPWFLGALRRNGRKVRQG